MNTVQSDSQCIRIIVCMVVDAHLSFHLKNKNLDWVGTIIVFIFPIFSISAIIKIANDWLRIT